MEERELLTDQLEEMLEEGAVDPEDALEIALVAGLAARLEVNAELLSEVDAWRKGSGRDLLKTAWGLLDTEEILASFDSVLDGEHTDDEVEEALLDIDELIAAAVWSSAIERVRPIAKQVSGTVRMMPELFEHLKEDAMIAVKTRSLAENMGLYDYWFAIVE